MVINFELILSTFTKVHFYMGKTSLLTIVAFFLLITVVSECDGYTFNAVVGQVVEIACGVQVNGLRTRLVWKVGQDRRELAYIYDGEALCDIDTKKDCSLKSDGSLVLRNVQEADSDEYYCVVDDEKYYSQHSLIIRPEVASPTFEVWPNSEDVFVAKSGSQEIVLAYTSPVCRNADVVGNVTCDPSSGSKTGSKTFAKIMCICTHLGNVVDTCEIPIPDELPSFENCPGSDSVSVTKHEQSSFTLLAYTNPICRNSKDVIGHVSCDPASGTETDDTKIVCRCFHSGSLVDTCEIQIPAVCNVLHCSPVTGKGIGIGFLFCAVSIAAMIAAVWFLKQKFEESKDNTEKGGSTESVSSQVQSQDVGVLETGQLLVSSAEKECQLNENLKVDLDKVDGITIIKHINV